LALNSQEVNLWGTSAGVDGYYLLWILPRLAAIIRRLLGGAAITDRGPVVPNPRDDRGRVAAAALRRETLRILRKNRTA